ADGAADRDRVHGGRTGAALHREYVVGRLHERDWVHCAAVDPYFIMKVVAGRTAGRAHAADLLAAGDMVTLMNEDRRHVAIARGDAAAMIDLDQISVAAAVPAGVDHGSLGGRVNRGAVRACEIDAGMEGGT